MLESCYESLFKGDPNRKPPPSLPPREMISRPISIVSGPLDTTFHGLLLPSPRDMYASKGTLYQIVLIVVVWCCPLLLRFIFLAVLTLGDIKTMKLKSPCKGLKMWLIILASKLEEKITIKKGTQYKTHAATYPEAICKTAFFRDTRVDLIDLLLLDDLAAMHIQHLFITVSAASSL